MSDVTAQHQAWSSPLDKAAVYKPGNVEPREKGGVGVGVGGSNIWSLQRVSV